MFGLWTWSPRVPRNRLTPPHAARHHVQHLRDRELGLRDKRLTLSRNWSPTRVLLGTTLWRNSLKQAEYTQKLLEER